MIAIEVIEAGLLDSVQAGARVGYRHLGVGGSGALDAYSLAVANLLVGNEPTAAALECTLRGPRLLFPKGARIALAGGEAELQVNATTVPGWRRIDLPAGAVLSVGACRRGARCYLAVAGGLVVEQVLGSASTDLRAGFGGVAGRALRTGDQLHAAGPAPSVTAPSPAPWWADPRPDLDFGVPARLRVLAGADALQPGASLSNDEYRVAATSNRQGLRLQGPALSPMDPRERLSEPVAPGTVQLPPDGQPIVLLAEAQTVGGYPRIGHVIRADWPRLAQMRPGESLRFEAIEAAHAHELACSQRQRLARISLACQR